MKTPTNYSKWFLVVNVLYLAIISCGFLFYYLTIDEPGILEKKSQEAISRSTSHDEILKTANLVIKINRDVSRNYRVLINIVFLLWFIQCLFLVVAAALMYQSEKQSANCATAPGEKPKRVGPII